MFDADGEGGKVSWMWLKLQDRRALLGAIALLITGGILSSMLEVYLDAILGTPGLPRSRLWWELVLNLQIFSVALMWFCFSDRIESTTGPLQRLQKVRRLFSMISVLIPTLLGMFGIVQGWYTNRPSPEALIIMMVLVALFWFLAIWVHMQVLRRRTSQRPSRSIKYRIAVLTPIYLIVLLFLIDYPSGGQMWILLGPFLGYMQASVPFFTQAFGFRGNENYL
jgi:small-conductance mechanosensitive channel